MKRSIRVGFIVGVLVLVLGSCTAVLGFFFPNQFTIAGASYDVAKLHILNYGQYETTNHYLDVYFVSEGINLDAEGGGSGVGDEISFWLISATPTLGEGTFTFNEDFAGSANTMYGGRAYVGADFSQGTSSGYYQFDGGLLTVSIAGIGDDYIIDFEGTTEDGTTISAHFRGPLEGAVINATTELPVPHY